MVRNLISEDDTRTNFTEAHDKGTSARATKKHTHSSLFALLLFHWDYRFLSFWITPECSQGRTPGTDKVHHTIGCLMSLMKLTFVGLPNMSNYTEISQTFISQFFYG